MSDVSAAKPQHQVAASAERRQELETAYRTHGEQTNRTRLKTVTLLVAIIHSGFSILDWFAWPAWSSLFLATRLGSILLAGIPVLLYLRTGGTRWAAFFGAGVLSIVYANVVLMIVLTGGFVSDYWIGLMLAGAGLLTLSQLGTLKTGILLGCYWLSYFLACWLVVGPPPRMTALVQPAMFLGGAYVIFTAVTGLAERGRYEAFFARFELARKELELEAAREQTYSVMEQIKVGRMTGHVLQSRYQLLEVLGRGSAGEVYLAWDVETRAHCAVKLLHPHLVNDEHALRRFMREAATARRVASEHVVRVFASGWDPQGIPYFVMEYVPGEDLGARLRRTGPMSLATLAPLVEQLAETLAGTHAAGVVHRDLKPQNIMITCREDQLMVKIIDFGICKALSEPSDATLTGTSALLGSPGYMAPEQVLGRAGEVGPAADVFSLAAVVYRALAGVPPFHAEGLMNVLARICSDAFQPVATLVPSVHPDVDIVLTLALAKNPEARLSSAREFARLLDLAGRGALPDEVRQRARGLTPASDKTLPGQDAAASIA